MTNEEKVKAYDEAMNKIKPLYEQAKKDGNPIWSTYEYLIPELAESEDEKIRKEIVDFIRWAIDRGSITKEQREKSDTWFSYLEKQKDEEGYEEIPVESTLEYKLGFKAGKDSERQKEQKSNFDIHWENGSMVCEQKEQKSTECLKAEKDGWYVCIKDFYGGGKKQCSVGDLVQAKGGMYMMGREDISEWFRRAYYEEVRDVFEPNTYTNIAEWSKEDSNIAEELYGYFYYLQLTSDKEFSPSLSIDEILNWLKSLPKRFVLQPKQEWSEEDERMRNQLIYDVEQHKKEGLISAKQNKATKALYNGIEECYDEKIAWLKSLSLNLKKKNEDVAKLCSNEWSEEDESCWNLIWDILDGPFKASPDGYRKAAGWFIKNCPKGFKALPLNLKKKNEDVAKLCSNEWSEEDENIFNDILVDMADRREMFKSNGEIEFAEDTQKKIDWLSSHLPKFQSSYSQQKSAEWSEEDKKMLLSIINAFRNGTVSTIGQEQWLKSLPERFNLEPKSVWCDEDEKEAEKAATDYADEFPGMTHENDGSTVEDYDKPYWDFLSGVHWAKTKIEDLRKNILM